MSDDFERSLTPDELQAFLDRTWVAVLSWTTADGGVASSPVWYEYGDGVFRFTTKSSFAKARALQRNPRISLCVQDQERPYTFVTARGAVTMRPAEAEPGEVESRLARRYMGAEAEAFLEEVAATLGDTLVVELVPDRLTSVTYS